MLTYTLRVAEIRQETEDTITLCFKQSGLKKIKYLPGQYLTLIFRINGRRFLRPYSFSSAPGIDQYLEVTIKRIMGGVVSNHIHDQVKVDDLIEVMQPLGDFTYTELQFSADKQIVLWGVGSGITPLMSIAKYALSLPNGPRVSLIYGNKNFESCIFLDLIHKLKDQYKSKFSVWHFHTRLKIDEENPSVIQGRIDQSKVHAVMNKIDDHANTIHYICGPVGLKESVKEALKGLSISAECIFSEDFEIVKNPKDFEGIMTQVAKIISNNQETFVEVVSGKSILEAGLDAQLELPYSCQTGNCSVCKGKLLTGKLKIIGIEKISHELKPDEYLLCCSYPLTNDVSVLV
ncbi:FAD-binding oxidoreductase [Mucilaginibacter sp. Mucisp84]|uniref:FAD-binding oxidoreductase n=1 Tax=Mucilaginibacter sp. Mucisp84 TaxID=3243058 RepID=UPI0039A446A4